MTSEEEMKKRKDQELPARRIEPLFENIGQYIAREMEKAFLRPWPPAFEMRFPSMPFPLLPPDVRAPPCDLVDRGDRYELTVEAPGIEKEKVDIKATRHSVEISGEQSAKKEEKGKNYLYNERSYKSFYRKIPVPEEVVPSNVEARMVNGILNVTMPKKVPTKTEGEETRVEVR
jgi:HSP20 family protein